jgi:high-affinity K+ transport system ATPase subunit B
MRLLLRVLVALVLAVLLFGLVLTTIGAFLSADYADPSGLARTTRVCKRLADPRLPTRQRP